MPGFNAITDVPGVLVGHHHRLGRGWATGTTVVLVPGRAVGAVDQRGGAPGTRETDLLEPENLVQRVDAICLSGGSAYGLAAADGVVRWLGERQRGFRWAPAVRGRAHRAGRGRVRPAAQRLGQPARRRVRVRRVRGGHGRAGRAGHRGCRHGRQVGSLKGGVGTASERVGEHTVGALVVVNASGEAVSLETGAPFAADHEVDGEFGIAAWPCRPGDVGAGGRKDLNTTIGVVATDADLSKAEARRLAVSAQDGLARAVRPAHTMYDGDTVFALATGDRPLSEAEGTVGGAQRAAALDGLCAAAARVFTRAMVRGVLSATSAAGLRAYRDVWPEAVTDTRHGR
ncbi:P1 family peptidase [Saccharomonospora sp. CUA-673]|uniref:P1 family peptidase n=1 Tax=Saccharomonospora sp. CUA-673 TaxID=1904969 RepID=UPI000AC272B9